MKTPCFEDLLDAAALLRGGTIEDLTVASRVGLWLEAHARDIEDRKIARQVGCTVKYLRTMRKEDASHDR